MYTFLLNSLALFKNYNIKRCSSVAGSSIAHILGPKHGCFGQKKLWSVKILIDSTADVKIYIYFNSNVPVWLFFILKSSGLCKVGLNDYGILINKSRQTWLGPKRWYKKNILHDSRTCSYLTLEVKSNTDFSKIQIHFETLIRRIRIRVKWIQHCFCDLRYRAVFSGEKVALIQCWIVETWIHITKGPINALGSEMDCVRQYVFHVCALKKIR